MVVNHSAPAVQIEHDLHAQQIIQKGHRGGVPSSTRRPPPSSPRAVYDVDLWGPSASPPLPSPHAACPHGPQPPGLSPRAEHSALPVRQWAAGAGRPTVRQRDDWPAPDGPAQPEGRRGRPRRRDPPPDRGPSGPAPTRRAASRDAGPGPAQPPALPPAPPPAPPPVPPPELLLRLGPAERPPPLWPVGPTPLRPTAFSPYKRSPASPATTAGGARDDPRNSLPGISPRSAPTPRSGPVVVRRFPSRSPPRNPRGTVRSRSAGAPPQRPSRPQPAPSTPHHPGPPQLALPAAKPPLAQRSPRAHQPQPPVPAPAPAPTQTQTPAPASPPGNAYLSYFYRHPSPAMEPVCPPPAPPPAPAPAPARPHRSRSQPPPPTSAAPNPAPGPPSAPPAAAGRPAPARSAVRKPSPSLTLTGPQPQLGSKAKGSRVRSASAPAEIRHVRGQERRAPRGPSRPKPAPLPPTQPSALSDASQTVDADLLSLLQAYEAASSSPSPSGSPRQAKAPPEVGSPASTVLAPQQSPRVPGHGRTFPFRRSASPGPPPAPPPRSAAPSARAPGRVRGSSPSTPTADPRRPEAAAAGRRPSPPTATPRPRAQRPGPPPSSPASRGAAPPAPRPPDCPPAPAAPVVASEASVETRVEASVDIPLIDISGVPDGSPEVTSVGESSGTDDAANASDTMPWRPPGLLQPVPAIIRSNSLGCETLLQSSTSGTSNSQPWLSCDSPNSRRSSGTVWEGPAHRAEDPASSDTVQSDTRRSNLVLSFNMTPETIPDLPPPRRPRTPKQMADAAKLIRRALVRFGRRYATLRQRETEGHTAAEGSL